MFISLNLLEDFIPVRKKFSPSDLSLALTMHTVEVESYQDLSIKYENIVIGEVKELKKHPQADRLKVAKVNVGSEDLKIVCGAPNLELNQKVPVALVGAVLPNGLSINTSQIRGETSQGMICSEDELSLGNDKDGIMVLDSKAKVGEKLSKFLGLNDVIIEIDNKSLSNRPDLWGHYGIAREIAAFSNLKFKNYQKILSDRIKISGDKDFLDIKVSDKKLCPYYSAVKLKNISIKESPTWLKNRLLAAGIKPINNLVDISNYVMIELGQPLHIFDAEGIDKILVRNAKEGESIDLLDKTEKKLNPNNLVITDGKNSLAIAGIMGGLNSGVKNETKEIIIESANFSAVNIRKSSVDLGLRTEASSRYEKSLDPNLCPVALKRALDLIIKIIPQAEIDSQISYSNEIEENKIIIDLHFDWLSKRLGKKIEKKEVVSILEKLGFITEKQTDKHLEVLVPSWRASKDVSIQEDLLEEVSRMIGYDNLPSIQPKSVLKVPKVSRELKLVNRIKDILAKDLNLSEVHNYSFVGTKQLRSLGLDYSNYLSLSNPLTENHTLLRQSLVVNIIENVKINQARFDDISIFELGDVYLSVSGKLKQDHLGQNYLPHQEKRIAICLASDKDPMQKSKDILQTFTDKLLNYEQELVYQNFELTPSWSSAQKSALVKYKDEDIAYLYTLNKKTSKNIGVKKSVVIVELNFKALDNVIKKQSEKKYLQQAKYPIMIRDVSLVIDKNISYRDLKAEIINFQDLICEVELFDVYQGDNIENNKKSLAFHVKYRLEDRTLKAEEVDEAQNKLLKYLQEKYQVKIRDF